MTVEADQARVELRLVGGGVDCPDCRQGLRPWGWARRREVHGIEGTLRPRRARCGRCLITHVLLPVTVLVRRAYAVEVIGVALLARADGSGHRRIAGRLGVAAVTVRGWLRVMGARLEPVRLHLVGVASRAGVDQAVPKALGCAWRDLLAALGAATAAVTGRFGVFGVLGPVTAWQVTAACSAGRLLCPGWPPPRRGLLTPRSSATPMKPSSARSTTDNTRCSSMGCASYMVAAPGTPPSIGAVSEETPFGTPPIASSRSPSPQVGC
ncbi:MAG: helix-turn-helix domain-containing protein [Actinomycetota bacterium]|nr:helix-turn-helix domain-containing protein [Actinomycetota bacterium]